MTPQQKLLWEKLTRDVKDSGEGNLRARELYDELCNLFNMEEKVIVSIVETENGLMVRLNEKAYNNIVLVGILEKLKLALLSEEHEEDLKDAVNTNQKYDA